MLIYDVKYYWGRYRNKLVLLTLLFLVLFTFKIKILGLLGAYLICENDLESAQVAFVLGGNAEIRASKAAEIYQLGLVQNFICTGEHHNDLSSYFDVPDSEAHLTKGFIEQMGVPENQIEAMQAGTSTVEEADIILKKCLEFDWTQVMIISDRFHTRRINHIFWDKFKANGIELIVVGVANNKYQEDQYWQSEKGFVMVIMEYIKLVHYHFFKA